MRKYQSQIHLHQHSESEEAGLGIVLEIRFLVTYHVAAQDKEKWKDLISETGEESKKSKAKKKRKRQWNPLASCGTGCAGK